MPRQDEKGHVVVVQAEDFVIAHRNFCAVVHRAAVRVEEESVVGHVGIEIDGALAEIDVLEGAILAAARGKVGLDPDGADRIDDVAGWGVHEALTTNAQQDDSTVVDRGNLTGDVNPRAVEFLAPRRAILQRSKVRRVEPCEGDGLIGTEDLGIELRNGRVDSVPDSEESTVFTRLLGGEPKQPSRGATHARQLTGAPFTARSI